MIVYITAEYPFIIKKNGNVVTSSKTDFLRIEVSEHDIIEVCPLVFALPRILVFDNDFCRKNDGYVIKVDLKGGYFLKLLTPEQAQPFSVISQSKLCGALVTVYRENSLKVSIETNSDFTVFTPQTTTVVTSEVYINGKSFVCCKCGLRTVLFDIADKIKKVFDNTSDECIFDGVLTSVTRKKDMAKHVLTTNFSFNGDSFIPESSIVTKSSNFSPNKLPLKHLPYAFAEEVVVGGDVSPYLSDELKDKADAVKSYFGNALGVFPSPDFKNPFNPLILYKKAENLYFARYLSVQFDGRLITNLKLNDF